MKKTLYLAANAVITGRVELQEGVNIWFHCVLRGDVAGIHLGKRVNLQDACVVHCDQGQDQEIGDGVVAGHRAILHGRKVGQGTLVGMGAILLGGSEIGEESLIAAGTVIKERAVIPARSLVAGVPGRIVRQVTDEEVKRTREINLRYLELAEDYSLGRFPGPAEWRFLRLPAPWAGAFPESLANKP